MFYRESFQIAQAVRNPPLIHYLLFMTHPQCYWAGAGHGHDSIMNGSHYFARGVFAVSVSSEMSG
jgi:hypothetical protein